MKTVLAVALCLMAMCAVVGLLMCVAGSMVSQAEEKNESNSEGNAHKSKG